MGLTGFSKLNCHLEFIDLQGRARRWGEQRNLGGLGLFEFSVKGTLPGWLFHNIWLLGVQQQSFSTQVTYAVNCMLQLMLILLSVLTCNSSY